MNPKLRNLLFDCRALCESGFSLVEVLVAAILLALGATVALSLFTSANQLFRSSLTRDSVQIAINRDLAEIQRRNRRFVCTNGAVCGLISEDSNDPTENEYTPNHPGFPSAQSLIDEFNTKQLQFTGKEKNLKDNAVVGVCSYYHPTKYPEIAQSQPSNLVQQFKTKALDTLPSLLTDDKGIAIPSTKLTRIIDIQSASSESPRTPHAYDITYRQGVQQEAPVLRRVRMVPTVAGWCP